ncbi:MAG: hypothetical protein FWF03_08165, partial [Defluviitaleaceae bacterium]|nr:hypothetical protein [Defluviitaleaceae bacterium]
AGLVCEFSGVQAAARLIALTFAVLLALMFLTGQMLGLDGTLQWGGADLTRGRASIVRFNNRIVAAFILFFLAAAAVAYAFGFASGLAEIVARAWGLFLKFMRWAGSRRGGSQPEADYSQALSDADIGGAYDAPDVAAHSEPWLIWVILERAFLALFVLATAAAAVAAVAYGCYRLYKLFYKKTVEAGSDEKEFLDAGFTLSFRRKGEARRLAPTNKVRRAFYKKVKKHMTKKKDAVSVGPSDTSWEIAKKIKASEDIDALTANYQEARYGG